MNAKQREVLLKAVYALEEVAVECTIDPALDDELSVLGVFTKSIDEVAYEIECYANKEVLLTVEMVKAIAMEYYEQGGDTIIECYTDAEIAEEIKSIDDLRRIISIREEQVAALEYFKW